MLHSFQKWLYNFIRLTATYVPSVPYACQHFILSVFLILTIRWICSSIFVEYPHFKNEKINSEQLYGLTIITYIVLAMTPNLGVLILYSLFCFFYYTVFFLPSSFFFGLIFVIFVMKISNLEKSREEYI